ncbi:hypothetical protein EGW08_004310 [Elysia chlorotica]|uniref:Uncharacterized protein n=1 Tax=Elysia chlorotica TaxID=188477 RepID=A0A3S1HX35_ELYCH|nr:hypothetical protein EGW08_004310 [Elysia chlorotica]
MRTTQAQCQISQMSLQEGKAEYVKSESCHRCDQLPSIELQNQALNSHDSLQTILRPVAIVSGNGNAMSPSIANKQGDLDFISREQSTEVTLSGRIEETKALDFHLTLGQHDGNDSYKKQLTDIQNCGAVKGKEPNSDLCHKMAQAAISESIPLDKSEDYEKDKSGSEIPAVNLAETSLSDRVQNLRLQEVEDSANTKIADAVYARKVQKTIVSNDGEIPDFLHIKVKSEKIVEKLPGNEEFGTCVNELRKED